MEIIRSYDRLISTMGFPILVRWHLYIESGPWLPNYYPFDRSASLMPLIKVQPVLWRFDITCGVLWTNYWTSYRWYISLHITGVLIVCSTVCSGADQRKHQNSVSLAVVKVFLWWLMDALTKGQSRGKCFHLCRHHDETPRCLWDFTKLQTIIILILRVAVSQKFSFFLWWLYLGMS